MTEKAVSHQPACDLPAARVREVKGTPHASRVVVGQNGGSYGGADANKRVGRTEPIDREEARGTAATVCAAGASTARCRKSRSVSAPFDLSLSDLAFSMDFEDEIFCPILEFQGWTMELRSAGSV